MFRLFVRAPPRSLPLHPFVRSVSSARLLLSGHKTSISEGHTVDKSQSPLHRDADVQSAAARAAKKERKNAGQNGGAGFDAARLGGQTGEKKPGSEGKGALKDQVGGQPGGAQGGGSTTKVEEAPGEGKTFASSLKNALGMEDRASGVNSMRLVCVLLIPSFSTSDARSPLLLGSSRMPPGPLGSPRRLLYRPRRTRTSSTNLPERRTRVKATLPTRLSFQARTGVPP
jgi:hypothetical protein